MHMYAYGVIGGLLIGLAAAVLLLLSGDMLGASTIVSSLALSPKSALVDPDQHWKLVFVVAFCWTANVFFASEYKDQTDGLADLSPLAFGLGGVLVGFGTKLGNGCTSGHGVCGMARFSKRSLASVCVFLATGMLTAFLTQEATTPFPKSAFAWLRNDEAIKLKMWPKAATALLFVLGMAALAAPTFHEMMIPKSETTTPSAANARRKLAPSVVSGVIFSAGLYVSRMVFPSVVFGFLNLGLITAQGGEGKDWNPTLMCVLCGAILVSTISYQLIDGYSLVLARDKTYSQPICLTKGSKFSNIPASSVIDGELIIGAFCFGLGWGITGLCPGPAIFVASIGVEWVLTIYWPCYVVGAWVAHLYQEKCGSRSHTSVIGSSKND